MEESCAGSVERVRRVLVGSGQDHDGAAGVVGVHQHSQHRPSSLGSPRQLVEGRVQDPR